MILKFPGDILAKISELEETIEKAGLTKGFSSAAELANALYFPSQERHCFLERCLLNLSALVSRPTDGLYELVHKSGIVDYRGILTVEGNGFAWLHSLCGLSAHYMKYEAPFQERLRANTTFGLIKSLLYMDPGINARKVKEIGLDHGISEHELWVTLAGDIIQHFPDSVPTDESYYDVYCLHALKEYRERTRRDGGDKPRLTELVRHVDALNLEHTESPFSQIYEHVKPVWFDHFYDALGRTFPGNTFRRHISTAQ